MKKLLVVMLVLGMAGMANAALLISVNGTINPADTTVTLDKNGLLAPSTCVIDVTGDGLTPQDMSCWLILENSSNASMTGGVMLYTGDLASWGQEVQPPANDVIAWLQSVGYDTESAYFLVFASNAAAPLNGKLFDSIVLTCTGTHDVKLTLVGIDDSSGEVIKTLYDTQIIHQIPEPMTLGLLGLGGLFLRRRK